MCPCLPKLASCITVAAQAFFLSVYAGLPPVVYLQSVVNRYSYMCLPMLGNRCLGGLVYPDLPLHHWLVLQALILRERVLGCFRVIVDQWTEHRQLKVGSHGHVACLQLWFHGPQQSWPRGNWACAVVKIATWTDRFNPRLTYRLEPYTRTRTARRNARISLRSVKLTHIYTNNYSYY